MNKSSELSHDIDLSDWTILSSNLCQSVIITKSDNTLSNNQYASVCTTSKDGTTTIITPVNSSIRQSQLITVTNENNKIPQKLPKFRCFKCKEPYYGKIYGTISGCDEETGDLWMNHSNCTSNQKLSESNQKSNRPFKNWTRPGYE